MKTTRSSNSSIEAAIQSRIRKAGPGAVFTPNRFVDLGSRAAVDQALSRQAARGEVRRLARGLYDRPRTHPLLGTLHPSAEAIAQAVAGKDRLRLQPSGAYAANLLGLSEQVPMKVVFLTDGPSRTVRVGKQDIILKRTTPRNMATAGKVSGLVIQALRYMGQANVDEKAIRILRKRLRPKDKACLVADAQLAPAWIAAVMRQIAA